MLSHVYPRGFVLSREEINPPANFIAGPVFDRFFVDAQTCVDDASHGEMNVVILGTCVSTEPQVPDGQTPARHMLNALLAGEEQFFDVLDQYCGRHVILFGTKKHVRILTDATGMRTCFYAAEGGVVASHARLVEEALGGEIKRADLPFRYGFPGNHTPYVRTQLLTPNTLYDFAETKIVRFWPRQPIKKLAPRQAAAIVRTRTTTALKRIAQGRRVSLSITAGIDSRATLALALDAGVRFDGYTYDRGRSTAIDCAVSRELAKIAGIEHHVVPTLTQGDIPHDVKNALDRATYYGHHHPVVAPMWRHFGDNRVLTVTANLLEIGRFFYKGDEYAGSLPDNPASMCDFALVATRLSAREMDEKHGPEARALATAYFADFIRDADFNAARGILDPRDQFYWEYKMSAWHGMILLERDFYGDCFIPFNSRSIFEALLGVPEWHRRNSSVFKILIRTCAPQLVATIPINPKQWPLQRRSAKEQLTEAVRWLKSQGIRIEYAMNDNGLGSVPRLLRKGLRMLRK